jgi:hypothetical protein
MIHKRGLTDNEVEVSMDYLLLIGFALCALIFLRQLGNERETRIRLIEIRVRRDAEEQAILQKIERERLSQKKNNESIMEVE